MARTCPWDATTSDLEQSAKPRRSRQEGDILLMPIIPFGLRDTSHGFSRAPSTSKIQHLLDFVLDSQRVSAHHGFRRISHRGTDTGSNMPISRPCRAAARSWKRRHCARPFCGRHSRSRRSRQLRESGRRRQCRTHANSRLPSICYLDADRVQMDKARKETGQPPFGLFIWNDLTDRAPSA